jgi:hypothetical protein
MTKASAHQCPDCSGVLNPIKLIARTPIGSQLTDSDGAVVRYAKPDAKRGWFVSQYEIAGSVTAMMCESCHRIFLYGRPGEGQ